MSTDLAIDYNTGDLMIAPSNDVGIRTGTETLEQEIRIRLRVHAGEWPLDPWGGLLGSHLEDAARMPTWRALTDVERIVREALAPMENLHVRSVDSRIDPKDERKILIDLTYSVVEPTGETADTTTTLSTSLTTTG
jgi:hypothetical protein